MTQGETVSPAPDGGATPGRPSRPRRSTLLLVSALVVSGLIFATGFAYGMSQLGARQTQNGLMRPVGIPANVSDHLAGMMQLSPVPHAAAPGFTLTDQTGRPVSLSAFRGKTVVLTFMDPHCTDVCPIVSREFIDAYRALGADASRVVFVAVNVNPYHRGVADVAGFSAEQHLNSLPNWYFLTGPLASLRQVWNGYQVAVQARGPKADVLHTSVIYFIDSRGRERYVVAPMDDHTKKGTAYLPAAQLTSWAHGMALVARDITR